MKRILACVLVFTFVLIFGNLAWADEDAALPEPNDSALTEENIDSQEPDDSSSAKENAEPQETDDAALSEEASKKNGKYKIGPGDVLEISVWKDESLMRQITVPPDSVISFPIIGEIEAEDMTVAQLREALTKKLVEYVPDATVTVLLLQINSLRAYVIGKVNKPGVYPIDMKTSVMQILTMAGGLNPFACQEDIIILRQKGEETTKLPFNYEDVAEGKSLEQNIILQSGDVVVVP